jgi:L-amino acid N-acyltransferase
MGDLRALERRTTLEIRLATERDSETMRVIYNHAVAHSTASFDLEPRTLEEQQAWLVEHRKPYAAIVADENGTVVGWGSISRYARRPGYDPTGEVSVYVYPEHAGRGLGAALLQELLILARKNGFHTVIALITVENRSSIALAERAGFARVGSLREVGRKFDRWLDVAVYQHVFD